MKRGAITAAAAGAVLVPLSLLVGITAAQGSSGETPPPNTMPRASFPTWTPDDNERNQEVKGFTAPGTNKMPQADFPEYSPDDNERDNEKAKAAVDVQPNKMPNATFPEWSEQDNERTPSAPE